MEQPSPLETFNQMAPAHRRMCALDDLHNFTINGHKRWGHRDYGEYVIHRLIGLTDAFANAIEDSDELVRVQHGSETTCAPPIHLSKAFQAIGDLASLALYMMEEV